MSDFRYKFMHGSRATVFVKETPTEYSFSLQKNLVAHDDIDTTTSWQFIRIAKNVFILTKSPEHLDEESKKLLQRLQ